MTTREIGNIGESAACNYLVKRGYVILERNFSSRYGEIDIIALSPDGCMTFVEVKTRKNTSFGYASEFVDRKKQQHIINTALMYCKEEYPMRFDVIEVYYKTNGKIIDINDINHIEGAF